MITPTLIPTRHPDVDGVCCWIPDEQKRPVSLKPSDTGLLRSFSDEGERLKFIYNKLGLQKIFFEIFDDTNKNTHTSYRCALGSHFGDFGACWVNCLAD